MNVPGDSFVLEPLPPFRLDLTVWVLRRRPDNVVDRWDGQTYRRALIVGSTPVEVAVRQTGPPDAPQLQVALAGAYLGPDARLAVGATLERMLGLRTDLTAFYRFAENDAMLGPLARQFRGFKPTRFPSLFEALVSAIACQQVTLTLGIRLLNRLAEAYGLAVPGQPAGAYAFPRPEDLAGLDPEALRRLAFSRQEARAAIELAHAIVAGRLDLERVAALDDEAAVAQLRQLRGVGRWTAEYVLLRGMGRTHLFPGDDVGARGNLQHWLGLEETFDYAGVRRAVDRWQPYAGLVYFHLLLKRLDESGYL